MVALYIVYAPFTVSQDRMLFRLSRLLFRGLFMYELVLWSISNFGDDIYHQITSVPEQVAISGISLLSVAIILRLSMGKDTAK